MLKVEFTGEGGLLFSGEETGEQTGEYDGLGGSGDDGGGEFNFSAGTCEVYGEEGDAGLLNEETEEVKCHREARYWSRNCQGWCLGYRD